MSITSDEELISAMSVASDDDVQAAMRAIDRGGLNTAFLIDPTTKVFRGLVTDGDVRRALLDGYGLRSPVDDIPRPDPATARQGIATDELTGLLSETVRVIPVLDEADCVVDIAVYDRRVRLPVASPSLGGNELRYVSDCILSGWISSAGKYVSRFEEMFADFCGTRHGVATSNGTTALHLALECLGIGPGDEVIVPTLTFVATANAVAYTGATPVFVDCDPASWNMDPQQVAGAIDTRTKAIIPVHLYGQPADMASILELGALHDLAVVEDAAQAHGALCDGRRVGSMGIVGTFSFYGNKTITTGEGGMLVTDDDEVADKARLLRDHGMSSDRRYWHPVVGYNYRMTNMQAAIGVAQMERVDEILAAKKTTAHAYLGYLADVPGLGFQEGTPGSSSTHWLFSFLVNDDFGVDRDGLMAGLAADGIETRPLFLPVHHMPPYESGKVLPQADCISSHGLSLPSGPEIGAGEVARICSCIPAARSEY